MLLSIFGAYVLTQLALSSPLMAQDVKPRIISLYAAHTEIVLRVGARANLVGISEQETYEGPETQGWNRPPVFSVGDDVEKFLAAEPDIILIRPQHLGSAAGLFESLTNAGIQIWVKQILHSEDLYNYWLEVGKLCGKETEAQKVVDDFKKALAPYEARTATRTKKPGVFFESVHKEVKTFTPDSIPIWVVTVSGGVNIATDALPARAGLVVADYGPEKLLAKASEIDVFLSQEGPMNRIPLDVIKNRDIYKVLPAVKNGRVYKVPEDLISRPTPSLIEGVALLENIFYPEDQQAKGESAPEKAK
ncbi:MAG: ABC transporter substrate-binding protein [Deltaproteobacteria bacterium]|jgi:iron complex transport system substrate-binding protein|nr:ABC transporter substrate-binding protein [Deltaproteobacteria bacterium]